MNTAVNQLKQANTQMNTAALAAANGQPKNAMRMANASANNLSKASNNLRMEANKAQALGNKAMANNLVKAANSARRAEILEALKHIANAIKTKNGNLS